MDSNIAEFISEWASQIKELCKLQVNRNMQENVNFVHLIYFDSFEAKEGKIYTNK